MPIFRRPAATVVVGRAAGPAHALVTIPNGDYNQLFGKLNAGAFCHNDHRFEWSRAYFAAWATGVAERHGYQLQQLRRAFK